MTLQTDADLTRPSVSHGHLQTDADLTSLWPCSMSSAIEDGESRALETGSSSSVAQSESALTFASASPPPAHLRPGGLAAMHAGKRLDSIGLVVGSSAQIVIATEFQQPRQPSEA